MSNYTNLVYFYSGLYTNFQLENNEYKSCNRNNKIYNRFNLLILTSTDLLDPLRKEGFYEFIQSKIYEYNPYKNALNINIILTKVVLETDRSLFIGFGGLDSKIIYEQEIQIVEKPKINENNNFEVKVEYFLNDRIKKVTRSYNKIDQIFAQSFSIIEIFFFVFSYLCQFLTNNQIEYELINKLYYTDKIKSNASYNKFKNSINKVINDNNKNLQSSENKLDKISGFANRDNIGVETENKEINSKSNKFEEADENLEIETNYKKMTNLEKKDHSLKMTVNNLTDKSEKRFTEIEIRNSNNTIKDEIKNGYTRNRTISIHESVNSLLSKNILKLNPTYKEINEINDDEKRIITLPSIKSFYSFKSGFKEQFYNILVFLSKNNSLLKKIEERSFLVEEMVKEIDLINIVGKQNQLSKMFEIFAYEKFISENNDSNIQFDEYYNHMDNLMKSKRVFL